MNTKILYAVMAGGRGTRLWPLSRQNLPKQLLHIDGDSLLRHTLARMPAQPDVYRLVVTTQQYAPALSAHVHQDTSLHDVQVLAEPYGCNTAAAVAQAVLHARTQGQDIVICVPADHIINDTSAYQAAVQEAILRAREVPALVLMGVRATQPSPLYGYIVSEPAPGSPEGPVPCRRVARFYEKPTREQAAQLIDTYHDQLWYNCGIFIGQTEVLYDMLMTFAPQVVHAVQQQDYTQCTQLSFDSLVLEHVACRYVVSGNFSWADIGSLELFAQQLARQTGQHQTQVVHQDSYGCTAVAPGKLVVLAGVQDITVIDTPDIVLVMKKDDKRRIDEVLHILATSGYQQYI